MAGARGGSHETAKNEGAAPGTAVLDNPNPTPGSNDAAVAASSNPTAEQVTQQGGRAVPAEGQRIREQAREAAEERGVVTLNDVIVTGDRDAVTYDERGALVDGDGNRIALAADAGDPDVGWTVQQARAEDSPVAYPGGPATVPDQTYHPDELPDPVAALRAGLLPQNTEVLNIDKKKFAGKKSLEA
jgi:hypothetical protein